MNTSEAKGGQIEKVCPGIHVFEVGLLYLPSMLCDYLGICIASC